MRFLSGVLLFVILGTYSSCCGQRRAKEPERPLTVRGWEHRIEGTTTIEGDFVLNKGESIDNGQFGIKLVDVHPAPCGLLSEPGVPWARLHFYEVSTGKLIYELIARAGVNNLFHPHVEGPDFEWSLISVSAINTKENWVAFQLRMD
jgi:hypothetical protein